MKVKVRYFTTLRELSGAREEALEMEGGSILAELIERVALKYGEEAFNYLHVRTTGKIDPMKEENKPFVLDALKLSLTRFTRSLYKPRS